jgi:UDP-N-acetylglucosamine--N-acetylmuramyl-(pentapeptide) pyrophosphoryl-undecaprenol N-acetylglucosamine transferase
MKKIIVAAGGTGGHLYPAIAVVEKLVVKYGKDIEVLFIGSKDKIEGRVVPALGYRFQHLDIEGLRSLFSLSTLMLPFKILAAQSRMSEIIKKEKPDVVLCAGAYVSYPVGMAAAKHKVPLFLLESNVQPGKANRLLAKKATKIFTSFQESQQYFPSTNNKCIVVGNPVRTTFSNLESTEEAARKFGFDSTKKTILVFGGSLGAKSINNAVMNQLLPIVEEQGIQLLWQTGANTTIPADLPKGVGAMTYIHDMSAAYSVATIVVCRAGATSLAELALVQKPAILIPYPFAAHNHQHTNAKTFSDKKAALLLEDSNIETSFKQVVLDLLNNDKQQQEFSNNIAQFARPNAANDVVEVLGNYFK